MSVAKASALSHVVPDLGKVARKMSSGLGSRKREEARVHGGHAGQDHLREPEAAELTEREQWASRLEG